MLPVCPNCTDEEIRIRVGVTAIPSSLVTPCEKSVVSVSASASGNVVDTRISLLVSALPSVKAFAPIVIVSVPAVSGGRIVASHTDLEPVSSTRLAPVENVISLSVKPLAFSDARILTRKSFFVSGSSEAIVEVKMLPMGIVVIVSVTAITFLYTFSGLKP